MGRCTYTSVHVETRFSYQPPCFVVVVVETGPLTDLKLAKSARLAGCHASRYTPVSTSPARLLFCVCECFVYDACVTVYHIYTVPVEVEKCVGSPGVENGHGP